MAKRPQKSVPEGLVSRTSKLLFAGAQVLGRELSMRMSQSVTGSDINLPKGRLQQVQHLVSVLTELRGAAMKAGQLLSLEIAEFFPPEVVVILSQLYDNAYFISQKEVQKVLLGELGPKKLKEIKQFSAEPIAAASIGQVHSGFLGKEKVAIKVQFPGVSKSIDSDLALLQKVVHGLLKIFKKKEINLDETFAELKVTLKREVDYEREAKNALEYKLGFSDDPRFFIPKIFVDYSTKKVLTLEFAEGIKLTDWFLKKPTEKKRQALAQMILDLLVKEFFELGLVQTDPNLGNFLLEEDPLRLIVLDFGAVRHYSKKFRAELKEFIVASCHGESEKIMSLAIKLELLDPREGEEVRQCFVQLMKHLVKIFDEQNQPFSFANEAYHQEIRKLAVALIKSVHFSAPARQLIFLNRKLGGMYHLLRQTEASIDMRIYYKKIIDLK